MRQVLIYPDEDGVFIAEVPSLPGCVSDGSTAEEALENVKEAIHLWISAAKDNGIEIPDDPPMRLETVEVQL